MNNVAVPYVGRAGLKFWLNKISLFRYFYSADQPAQFVNYLFNSIVVYNADQATYKVYEFKLHPGKYHAHLVTINGGDNIKEVTFWKEGGKWKVQPPTKNARYVVEVIVKDIDRLMNRG